MSLVNIELANKVATITLQNGKVNAISNQLIDELNIALDSAEQENAVVILTGQAGMFSGGYDLATMKSSPEAAIELVTKGSKLVRRLLAFPTPVISACSGHAIAKGAFILLGTDYRIGSDGPFKVGLNEVAIGMTMHNAGIVMAHNRIPMNYRTRAITMAEIFSPTDAIKAGFLDTVVAPEQLMATAQGAAEQLKQLNMTAHHQTKLKERADILAALDKAIEDDLAAGGIHL